ncbi:pre-mRNA splicing factor [Aspergillus luchuensis]|uniref:Pre-mRNA splicing factor n=1 Tax=Aspergillus kawachii TaxID=1069201 RepID=A0A146FXX3_ASPKA|nr:pre-mRNA splicing factor [Aspergillus luchuensis]
MEMQRMSESRRKVESVRLVTRSLGVPEEETLNLISYFTFLYTLDLHYYESSTA